MRRFTRRQDRENAAFLAALRRTGNPRLAARELGVHRSTYMKRRAKSAAFAAEWDAALLACHAALKLSGGPRLAEGQGPFRTRGGEIVVGRTRGGRLQLRRAPPGRMTQAGEQAFLTALSSSANVRLSAAAAGFTHSAFYQRRRAWPGFATEMKVAVSIGYDRVQLVALAAAYRSEDGTGADSAWRDHVGETPLPPMSWDQAFQLLCHHHRTVELKEEARMPMRKRRGESWDDFAERRRAAWRRGQEEEAARRAFLAESPRARHYEETGSWRFAHEQPPPKLPPLHLVTGWSKADPARVRHNPNLALFGGWRITDWKKKRRG